jgi:hypothetical protein
MSNDEMVVELEQKLKTLQLYHAAALADSVVRYGNEGVLEKVAEQKRAEQMKGGAGLAARFGITEPKQAIEKTRDTYGCADWVCTDTSDGFEAVATRCSLCAISKQMGQFNPCHIYCLSPMEAMIIGVAPEAEFSTLSTLWDSDKCKLCVKLMGRAESVDSNF